MKKRDLDLVRVRPIRAGERKRFERLMDRHHYLGWGQPVGETMLYVAESQGKWIALLAFGAAAYALKDREEWIGWDRTQRKMRLNFVVQNRRFLILPGKHERNMASHVLSLCTKRLAMDWEQRYGHPVWLVETFVDPQRYEGTCYRAAGWEPLGLTVGAKRIRRDFYDQSGSPKQLFVKALRRDARRLLSAEELPAAWQPYQQHVVPTSPVGTAHSRSLWQAFAQIPEFRAARGLRHSLPSVLACAACAVLAGAENIAEIAEIAAGFEHRHLRALRCFRNRCTGRYEPPSETTFRRVLKGTDAELFDTVVARWVAEQEDIDAIAFDGKALKGCLNEQGKPLFLVSAVAHGNGAFQGQVQVDSRSNEIPAARELLDSMPSLDGVMTTADAAHTQNETARKIVQDKGGDYLLPLKGNQPSILQRAERTLPQGSFSPSTDNNREEPRSRRNP
jgi:hypothetical protein